MKFEELSKILRQTDPAAVLVERLKLEGIIQNVTGLGWMVWRVPHRHCFVISREVMDRYVSYEELKLSSEEQLRLPETVLLLEKPTAEQLNNSKAELLLQYWRLLFHAAIHRDLEPRQKRLSPTALRERIEAIGPAAFEEARNVLIHDGYLHHLADDGQAYVEFVAYYLELYYFHRPFVKICFPSLPGEAVVHEVLKRDIDAETLFHKTRLPGTPDPNPHTDDQSDESYDYFNRLKKAAERAGKAGDTVGSAILYTRAARVAPGEETEPARRLAREQIARLVDRLTAALELPADETVRWKQILPALLDKADQGTRTVEAALLYDIQRACLDHEEKIYELDVAEWIASGGYRPIKRELVGQRYVRVPTQLRSAARRLAAARLTDSDRTALTELLQSALGQAERQLRTQFRPLLDAALRDAGLRPTSLPESKALKKTIEELLDRISSAGFLSFGDLRDAIARGQMKLPDIGSPREHVHGDPLLRLDRRLATQLDGVYRRAESYTRGLERVTALSFGTETGRWLTRHVALPFGAAFLFAQFLWLLYYERLATQARRAEQAIPSFFGGWNAEWWFHAAWLVLGFAVMAVIRSPRLQSALLALSRTTYRIARFVFWELPARIWAAHWVRLVLSSLPFQIAHNYGLRPLVISAMIWLLPLGIWESGWPARVFTYIITAFLVNTRLGMRLEGLLIEAARNLSEWVQSFPAVLRWMSDLFRELVGALEWALARIEDGLRLRGQGGPFAILVRTLAGLVWMPFAFFIRFYTIVLIEPMINPLKLPLSILFAKFVYPLMLLSPALLQPDSESVLGYSSPLVGQLAPYLTYPGAWLLVMGTLWLLPDAVTFLFWEMRENWRLYRANRPEVLRAVAVGDHGESIRGLLHWGFHSGTVPRLYAKLRAAEREAARTNVWRDARTYHAALRAVEAAVRRFVVRDFIDILNDPESQWGGPKLAAGRVLLGIHRIRLELQGENASAAWLEWEVRHGWLLAGWVEAGFLRSLTADQTRIFTNALAYLYKRAGVDLVHEQLRAVLPQDAVHFDLCPDGFLVWYGSRDADPLLYDIAEPAAKLQPRRRGWRQPTIGPVLDAERLIFRRLEITWTQWTEVWRSPTPGDKPPQLGRWGSELPLMPVRGERSPPHLLFNVAAAS